MASLFQNKKNWAYKHIFKKIISAMSSCEACTAHLHIVIFIQIFMVLTIWMNECYRWLPRSFQQKLKLCLLLWKKYFFVWSLGSPFVNILKSETVPGFVHIEFLFYILIHIPINSMNKSVSSWWLVKRLKNLDWSQNT